MKTISMKTLLALLLAALMLLGGCQKTQGAQKTDPENAANTAAPAADVSAAPEGALLMRTKQEAAAAALAMHPVLDSIVRSMGVMGGSAYAPADPGFFWSVLYLTAENWSTHDPRIVMEGEWNDIAVVPEEAMQDIARAAFGGNGALVPLPADMELITYDEQRHAYRLAGSDSGDTDTRIERAEPAEDGTILATLGLYEGAGARLGAIRFTLSEKAQADAFYPWCVLNAIEDTEPFAAWTQVASDEAFMADLDGDGEDEKITLTFPEDWEDMARPQVFIEDNGNTYTDAGMQEDGDGIFDGHAYLADIAAGDGRMEIVITGDMASDDYVTRIYRYENGALSCATVYGTAMGANGGNRLRIGTYVNLLGTYGATCDYYMSPEFEFTRESPYTIVGIFDSWDERVLTLQKDALPVTKNYTEQTTLPAGTELKLVSTDQESYAELVDRDGVHYSIEVTKPEDDWQFEIGGIPESEWFGELMYAG